MSKLSIALTASMAMVSAQPATLCAQSAPKAPRFSVDYMDKTVDPGTDFYHYADGTWLKNNPVPPDKSRWAGFIELQERNWNLIRQILDDTGKAANQNNSPAQKVGDFYRAALDTNRLEELAFKPLESDLKKIDGLKSEQDLMQLLADFHQRGIGGFFSASVSADSKNSAVYAFYFSQGGLGLPDRDYYLTDGFSKQRSAYGEHVAKMFRLLGEKEADAKAH